MGSGECARGGHIRTLRSLLVVALRTRDRDQMEAERILRDVIARAPETTDEGQLLRALTKLHLGDLLIRRGGDSTEAESLFRDALQSQEAVLGDRNLALTHGLGSLADVVASRGRFAEAESLIARRVEISRGLLGDENVSTIIARTHLAGIRVDQGQLAEAEAIRAEALADIRRVAGEEHTYVAGLLASLADVVSLQGDQARAEALMRDALTLRIRLNGPTHHLVYSYRSQLALIPTGGGQTAEKRRWPRCRPGGGWRRDDPGPGRNGNLATPGWRDGGVRDRSRSSAAEANGLCGPR
jgi:hypothetical protein